MKIKTWILAGLLALLLIIPLSGCGTQSVDLSGKHIVTFEMNGGTLDVKSTTISTKVHFAYDPGAHIVDPSTHEGYKISRYGYTFEGWFKTEECREEDRWDFSKDVLDQEKITLYAGWTKDTVYSFTVCYMDGKEKVTLGSYNVSADDAFKDYRNFANSREKYTAVGYYADPACTEPWDFETKHPGGATDLDICVYVDYIEGEWKMVSSYRELVAASGSNIYLTTDIDCGGKNLYFSGEYSGIFEGNGHTISNFKVEKSGSSLIRSSSIFQTLSKGACIRNVSFTDVTFLFSGVENATKIKVSALAREGTEGCTVQNVSVSGKIVTDYTGTFPRLNEAFFEETDVTVKDFKADITVTTDEAGK